ncbi:EAL domain-containing protein [Oxalobacteraceae bacterium A2-2]
MPVELLARLPRPRRATAEWLVLALVLLMSGLMAVYFIWSERRMLFASDIERMRMQTLIIDENLRHQLEGVRNALDSARAGFNASSGCNGSCRQVLLQSLKRAMPGVRALVVVDREGRIQKSDDDLRDARLDDRAYTSNVSRMRAADTLYLSQPYENTPGVFNIKLSLAILDAAGHNDGAVSAILNPEYFDAVMRSAMYANDMNSSITENGGRRILYVPADPGAMRADASSEPFFRRHQQSGLMLTVLAGADRNGEQRLVVQRTMQMGELGLDKTLVVSLSRSQARIEAGWHGLAVVAGMAWALTGAVGAIGLWLAQRRRMALEGLALEQEAERAAAAERVELALNGANLGLWEWHLPTDIRKVDARAAAMLGYAPGELPEQPGDWRRMAHPDDLEHIDAALALHLNDSTHSYEAEYRMRHRNGHWVWLQSRGKVIERDAAGKAVRMVGTRMDISARKLAEAEIAHLAFYDGLTNLPNRRLLLDRLGHAIAKCERGGCHGAVLFVDLDNFKALNDTMGHDMGDRLLEMVAFRLQQVTRDSDTVARLGGDEFVILLEDLGGSAQLAASHAEVVAQKVVAALSLCYPLDGHELRSTPSIGVVLFGGGSHTINDLLRQADMAMYEAKAAGRATFRFFDPVMQAALDATATLEADLRYALVRRELVLHYQPVVDAHGRTLGAEALLRWQHPRRGLVLPGEFIPQAEKSGLIIEIGVWVIETACQQLVRWAQAPHTRALTVAVNVSARQFRHPAFAEHVLQIVERSGANPHLLKLELTESMLLADVEDIIAKMAQLKARGVGFSLDDFGTGYSSLSYLKRLPIDQLKIDRSFVQDMLVTPHASTIVRSIVSLAHSMGLSVVAEGVESCEQWDSLRQIGCTALQGYLFGRAVPAQDLLAPGVALLAPPAAVAAEHSGDGLILDLPL